MADARIATADLNTLDRVVLEALIAARQQEMLAKDVFSTSMVSSPFFTDKNVSWRGIYVPPVLLLVSFLYQGNPSLAISPGLDCGSLFIVPEAASPRIVAAEKQARADMLVGLRVHCFTLFPSPDRWIAPKRL